MDQTTAQKVTFIAKTLLDRKAQDVVSLDVTNMTIVTDCFVLASGNSALQVKALADYVEDKMMEQYGMEPKSKDGYAGGRWIVLAYPDILVHIFHREEREFYSLERLWAWSDGSNLTKYTDESVAALEE